MLYPRLRRYARDNSVFLDDEYLIKGVAGRVHRGHAPAHPLAIF